MPKPLVIVESPAKARTLSRFLGSKYRVEASYGHVRDLPGIGRRSAQGDQGQVVGPARRRHRRRLHAVLRRPGGQEEVRPAAEGGAEGRLRSHSRDRPRSRGRVDQLAPQGSAEAQGARPPHRLSRDHRRGDQGGAARRARDVDENLVRAQESRRILDRLYGYTLSPVLWKKVQTGLSAGRVQSVAVRLIVEREEERMAFRTASYWDLEAKIRADEREFTATLVRLGEQRVATGKDFDARGELTGKGARVLDEAQARALVDALSRNLPWTVTSVEEKPFTQRPAPPFTTSTLQQDANRKFGFSAERTMQVAQRLFQGVDIGGGDLEGLISYHRTDSTTLSDKALREAGQAVTRDVRRRLSQGAAPVSDQGAQRPGSARGDPSDRVPPHAAVARDAFSRPTSCKVYDLIWKRAIASQMADARLLRTTVEITGTGANGEPAILTASGKAIEFAGYLRAYVEGSDDPAAELDEQETLLPKLTVGERIHRARQRRCAPRSWPASIRRAIRRARRRATPKRRWSSGSRKRASAVRRPTRRRSRPFSAAATCRGRARRSCRASPRSPSRGSCASTSATTSTSASPRRWKRSSTRSPTARRTGSISSASSTAATASTTASSTSSRTRARRSAIRCSMSAAIRTAGLPVRVRIGRYGPFLQVGESSSDGPRASLPEDLAPADLTCEKALALLKAKAEGPRSLGEDPDTGQPVYVMSGRFGPYVQLGETPTEKKAEKPRRASLGADVSEETIDARRGAEAAVAAARAWAPPTTARRSSPTSAASART